MRLSWSPLLALVACGVPSPITDYTYEENGLSRSENYSAPATRVGVSRGEVMVASPTWPEALSPQQ